MSGQIVDPSVFQALQQKIDDDTKVRDEIRDTVQDIEKQEKVIMAQLSNAITPPMSDTFLNSATRAMWQEQSIQPLVRKIHGLSEIANRHPYYKYNQLWSRQMQDASYIMLLNAWLGGMQREGPNEEGLLLSLDQVGLALGVPTNVKDGDRFHLTLEEYLHSLISLIDELARIARNSVTQGNYIRPKLISQFVKDLHAGFQILNLKNDSLRKRSDGIKYRLREVEDIIYDLSLRGLLPKDEPSLPQVL